MRKPVKLILCCTVMEIVIPKLMTLLARKGSLGGALLVQGDGIPSPVVPLTKVGLIFSLMFA